MLNIYINTGTAYTHKVLTAGSKESDLIDILEWIWFETEELEGLFYEPEELETEELERMIPLNGGEVYLNSISHIEELETSEAIEELKKEDVFWSYHDEMKLDMFDNILYGHVEPENILNYMLENYEGDLIEEYYENKAYNDIEKNHVNNNRKGWV